MVRKTSRQKDGSTAPAHSPSAMSLGWSPFHAAAEDYFEAGYLPIPLPEGKKFPPPKGVPNDIAYTDATLDTWMSNPRHSNIGTIVPDGYVVLDIDGPAGMATLAELEERLGDLPPTWCTFRGDPERYHLWFSTRQGLAWPGKLGPGLDIIYRHYRYVVVPPSVHPSGAQYRWANLAGKTRKPVMGYLPSPDEFSDLPEAWESLANTGGYVHRERAEVDSRLWLSEFGNGKACPEMKRTVALHGKALSQHADLGGMHDAMVNGVWAILSEMSVGHAGGAKALRRFRDQFFEAAGETGRREPGAAEAEWSRACIGAIEKVAMDRVRQGDPCDVEEDERGLDPERFFDGKHGLKAVSLREGVEGTGKLGVGTGGIIYRHTDGLWVPDGEPEIYRRTARLLGQRYRPGHAANVLSVVANREPLITDDRQDTRYLNLPNGLLDWEEGRLYPHNSNIISTVRIPIEWNEDAECPAIDEFFGEVFPGDAIELAYEILGYMLFNDNPLHKAILLYGSGRNGKGTFIRLARMLVGHNNISAVTPQALDSSQFSSAQLYGKLANLVGDVDPRIFKSTEQFKQLTGGDYMMAQHKHKDPFVFRCRALMIAAFNALPRTADTTEGFFSRWAVIPFTAFFPAGKADPTLIDRLTTPESLQGLLRASVGGLQTVMRRGALSLPRSVAIATERFKREADPMRGFIEERISFEYNSFTGRTEIYTAYSAWAGLSGFHAMAAPTFYEKLTQAAVDMTEVPILPTARRGVRGYKGIVLK